MKQPEQPLYPKTSSIYNKIMQLASAIMLIIVLMNMWTSTVSKNEVNLQHHFSYLGDEFLQQATAGIFALVDSKGVLNKHSTALKRYINTLANHSALVKNVHLYDQTGSLLISSTAETSVNDLYGISPQKLNRSEQLTTFVQEIRTEKLHGYLRITIEKTHLIQKLATVDEEQQSLFRLMLLMAGIAGFLLTRGLNRFSRQGYRIQTRVNDTNKQ
jgi:membrane protein